MAGVYPELSEWDRYEVRFVLGVPPGTKLPDDGSFFKWLVTTEAAIADPFEVRPIVRKRPR